MTTRFLPGRGVIVVPARVTGLRDEQTILLALDTGAAYTMLTPSVLRVLGDSLGPDAPVTRIATVTEIVSRPMTTIIQLAALGQHRRNMSVVVSDLPPRVGFHGLLGLDFLRNSRLTIDFRRGEVDLET